jgi:hypothetical protein
MASGGTGLVTPRTKRISRKDRYALAISFVALVVSGFSWWNSYEVMRLQLATTERRLKTVDASLYHLSAKPPHNASVFVRYQNVGVLAITVNKVVLDLDTLLVPKDDSTKACLADIDKNSRFPEPPAGSGRATSPKKSAARVGPGFESVLIDWPQSCPKSLENLIVGVSYSGKDELGNRFGEDDAAKLKDDTPPASDDKHP